jgi:hypothetical protein
LLAASCEATIPIGGAGGVKGDDRALRWLGLRAVLWHNPVAVFGITILGLAVLSALLGPWLTPHEPNVVSLRLRFTPPAGLPGCRAGGRSICTAPTLLGGT